MSRVYFLDSNDLIYRMKAGLPTDWLGGEVPADAYRFLEDLVATTSPGDRLVLTRKIIDEIAAGSGADAVPLRSWLENNSSIEIHELTPEQLLEYSGPNGGERSLFDISQLSEYSSSGTEKIFVTGDARAVSYLGQNGIAESNIRFPADMYGEAYSLNPSNTNLFDRGVDFVENVRRAYKAPLGTGKGGVGSSIDNGIFGKNTPSNRFGDLLRSIMADESGKMTLPGLENTNFDDLPASVKSKMIAAAGELVGAAAIALDAYLTAPAFNEAVARGDLAAADELLGGLIGRAFGGAFLGAVAGTAFAACLPAAIVASIAGGIIGALGGSDIGSYLAGLMGNLGIHPSLLLASLQGLLRDLLSDPLVLDLDGDGIELTSLSQSITKFDLDSDGALERTGWVSPQDGFLVHDLNGNDAVDGIQELFGNANTDGFNELEAMDSNSDGKIDAADAQFSELRIWRDLNSDGLSSIDEIQSLAQAGISALSLNYSQVDQDVAGNNLARTANYTRSDGTTRMMGSVDFALEETAPVISPTTDLLAVAHLPNLLGQPGVPDLRVAMANDPILKAMVDDLANGSNSFNSFEEFKNGGFVDIVYRWAGVDTSIPQEPGDLPYYVQALSKFLGRPFGELNNHQKEQLDDVWPAYLKEIGVSFLIQAANLPSTNPFLQLRNDIAALDPADPGFSAALEALFDLAKAESDSAVPAYAYLDIFADLKLDPIDGSITGNFDAFVAKFVENQPPFTTFHIETQRPVRPSMLVTVGEIDRHPWSTWFEDQGSLLFTIGEAMGYGRDYVLTVTGWRWLSGVYTEHDGTAGSDLLDFTVTYYQPPPQFSDSPPAPAVATRDQMLFGYEGNDELRGNDGVDRLIGGTGNDLLKGGTGSDMYIYASGDGLDRITDDSGTDDAIYFSSEFDAADLVVTRITGTNDLQLHFGDPTQGIILTNQWSVAGTAIEHVNFVGEQGLHAGDIASLYLASLATAGADTITGSWASERLVGLDGNDTLSGADGNDTLEGGTGDDILKGNNHDDVINGGAGNDSADGGEGNDVLAGGTGNDVLTGWNGSDTYVFNIGDGQDTIRDFWSTFSGGFDTVLFGAGILPEDLVVTQVASGTDLLLSIAGTTDSILLDNTVDSSDHRIEQVQFANGTVLSHADLIALSTQPTAGDDIFYGSYDPETLQGGAGNDTLSARGGNDTLIGGTGNDVLTGWTGNDTYVFNIGDGQDTVSDFWSTGSGGTDTVLFGTGILPEDLVVTQADNGQDLLLSIAGTTDSILLNQTVDNSDYRIEQVQFANGTILSHADLIALSTQPTAGNDTFYGSYDPETLQGGAGNDTLNARGGNDTLIGGTGNDALTGWTGNDTYVFNIGDGQDTVRDFWSTGSGGSDTVLFGAGILPEDLVVTQVASGTDLLLSIAGTMDSILLDNTVDSSDHRIEQVQFANGTVLSHADLIALSTQPTAGDDIFYGSYDPETLQGGAGNDTLSARGGNDTLIGGTGNDVLTGWTGNDTYVFNIGDGQDTVSDFWSTGSGGFDTVLFGTGILPEDLVVTQLDSGRDLLLSIAGTTDSILLNQTVDNGDYRIEQVQFANGTIMTHADLIALSTQPTPGNDIFYGSYNSETLQGGAGDDTLYARDGNDTLIGGEGDDRIDGGSGTDTASYADSATAVTVSLAITAAQDTVGAGTDTLVSIENLTGSSFGDTLVGSTAANVIDGGDGNDVITGGAGNDSITGGLGSDTLIVAGTLSTYTLTTVSGQVKLTDTATTIDGNDGTDTLVGIETVQFKDQSMGITSPIILDLDGNGIEAISASASNARFDMNADGKRDDTSWIGGGDGFLFLDRDGNGTLTGVGEMSFVDDLPGATTDLQGLRAFDSNGDGVLSSEDERFAEFHIWRDANGDGTSQHGEILGLADVGLKSLSLTGVANESTVQAGDVAIVNTGSWTRSDGTAMALADAAMTYFATGNAPHHRPGPVTERSRELWPTGNASWRSFSHREGNFTHWSDFYEPEFELAGQRDRLYTREPVGSGDADLENRLAGMVQDMASFGAGRGSRLELRPSNEDRLLDIFAA